MELIQGGVASREGVRIDPPQVATRQRRLAFTVAAAVGLHAALLAAIRPAPSPASTQTLPMTVRLVAAAAPSERRSFVEKAHLDGPVATETARGAAPPGEAPQVRKDAVARADRPSAAQTEAESKRLENDSVVPTGATEAALRAAVAPALPPAPDYLSGGQLDPGPHPLQDIEPVYPENTEMRSGSVVLRLLINERGEVDNAAVVRSAPKDLFETSALAAFGSARFAPGRVLGIPVKSQITIEVLFTPINRGSQVSGRSY